MTIDTHGRQHRPAGSPASTGGQFAAEQAPGQAQELGLADHASLLKIMRRHGVSRP